VGPTRIVFAPELELSLSEAQELASVIERWSGTRGLTIHWRADDRSPEVLVDAAPRHFERVIDKLLAEIGGFGPLGTPADPVPLDDEERSGRALVVASEPSMREICVMFLSVLGLAAESVATYAEAEQRVRSAEYDLLVVGSLDVEADDPSAMLAALEPHLGMTTPVLFWTEAFLADAPAWLEGLQAPLMLFSRPNDFHDFRAKVRRALEWRHLVRMRRRVRAYIDEQVAVRMRAFSESLLGTSVDAPQSSTVAEPTVDIEPTDEPEPYAELPTWLRSLS
jgi:hypothetical protein